MRIISAIHREEIANRNIRRSFLPIHELHGVSNLPAAFNTEQKTGELTMFVHEDVLIDKIPLSGIPPDWGVIGVAGVRFVNGKRETVGHILDRGKAWGSPIKEPMEAQTVDELLFITRGDIIFDENLPFDFYGADACMQARERGQKVYVVPAWVEHNSTRPFGGRTPAF